jgi:hypothetical protein
MHLLLLQGLNDMCMWINIITKNLGRRNDKTMLSEPVSTSPPSSCGRHPYSSPQQSFYSDQSYSSLPSSPSLSRPDSLLSDYSLFVPRSQAPMTKPAYTSCPTTPLSYRRYTTAKPSTPPPSPYRSNHIKLPSQPAHKLGVFRTLYRPDLIKLSSPRQGRDDSDKKSLSHSSVDFRENSIDVEYKTESSTVNDDYSVLCDELLEECEADVIYGNGSQNKVKKNIGNAKINACMNHKQVLHVNNMKTVEIENITSIDFDIEIADNSDKVNHIDQHSITHEDYFNNLLAIIEEAAHSLKTL